MVYLISTHLSDLRGNLQTSELSSCMTLTHMWQYHNRVGPGGAYYQYICNIPAWSLSVEWLFNIIMFVLIKFIPVHWSLLIFEYLAWLGYQYYPHHFQFEGSFESEVYRLLYPFFTGIVVFMVVGKIKINKIAVGLIGDASCLWLLFNADQWLFRNKDDVYTPYVQGHWLNFHMTEYSIYLIVALDNSLLIKSFLSLRPFQFLGKISFSVYLSHMPFLVLCQILIQDRYLDPIQSKSELFTILLCAIGLGYVMLYKVETPGKSYLDTFFRYPMKKNVEFLKSHKEKDNE